MISITIIQNDQESVYARIGDFKGQTITLGRYTASSKAVDIFLPSDSLLSRSHGYLKIHENGSISYTDESKLGTIIDGRKINRQTVVLKERQHEITFAIGEKFKIVIRNAPATAEDVKQVRANVALQPVEIEGKTVKINIDEAFRAKKVLTIGRGEDNDIVLDSLNISRRHASVELVNGDFYIKDLGSKNGSFVNGNKVFSTKLELKDLIQIGPFEVVLLNRYMEDDRKQERKYSIVCNNVFKEVKTKTKPLRILQKSSFKLKNNSLVAIMGPSGCGKSTLLNTMSGLNPATGGGVYVNGHDLYLHYNSLKKQFGYVPQDDIVHTELTVFETLWYAAKLRLEQDITDRELNSKIDKILKQLKIYQDKDKQVSSLSGGGRKRVCIASELLTEPSILFLDEPTSPLDPASVTEFLTILKTLADQGTTIVIVTHKPGDLKFMDEVIFLATGGYQTYHGAPGSAMFQHFGKQDINGIYEMLNDHQQALVLYKDAVDGSAGMNDVIQKNQTKPKLPKRSNSLSQLYWLSRRYLTLKLSDRKATLIVLLQAPFIAIIMLLIFDFVQIRTLYFLAICAIWCGVNNAAREIASEVSIYKRERMYNLVIFSYLTSKVLVQSILILIQTIFFLVILQLAYGLADNFAQFLSYGAFLFYLTLSATFMGLFVSAIMQKADKVTSMLPLVLLPQILLAGVISPIGLNGAVHVDVLSQLSLGRWGTQGLCNIEEYVVEDVRYKLVSESAFTGRREDVMIARDTILFTDILRYPDRLKVGKKVYDDTVEGGSFRQFNLLHDYIALTLLNLLFIGGIVYGLKKMDPL